MSGNQPAKYQVPTGVGLTAVGVAAARAGEGRHDDPLFDDPFAADFVTAAGDALSFVADHHPSATRDDGAWWSWAFAYVPIRTRFFDDYLREACAQGCRQVLVLAAGLDARAFRLAWPPGVCLFELDTAEVLTFKDQVLAGRAATPACRRVTISVDLRQDWPAAVLRAGFHPGEPTAWLAEGLLPYLNQDECDHLLEGIGRLSAPGSRLALEYVSRNAVQDMIDNLGESPDSAFLKTLWQSGGQEDPTSRLSRDGWQVHRYDANERAQSYGRSLPDPAQAARAADSGLIIARRR
ncbi:MAG: SAM-dependent methyltransferase [Pseudonocardiales bacterium]|nr:SAM-dependent methyltransferase [Pseudonocardiales bacterium]MBV9029801.1 SAM-dependent methyltransferase [Pseudonocardiales bacterium]MBW0008952.1 SAM-dependent methyltransferase [Pseudonocardiales bacterium]